MAQQKPVKTTKNKYKNLGGETGNAPFDKKSPVTYLPGRKATNVPTTKKPKAKNGKSLGMKSVKAGFDKNPGVTRADIITAATKKAKTGSKIKKAEDGALTYTNPRGKQYSLPQGASGSLKITRPNGSTRTIENREKYTKKMKRVFDRNTVDGVRQGTMTDTRQKNGGVTKKAKSGASMKKCKYGCK